MLTVEDLPVLPRFSHFEKKWAHWFQTEAGKYRNLGQLTTVAVVAS